jgi:serine/threonine protein kinase
VAKMKKAEKNEKENGTSQERNFEGQVIHDHKENKDFRLVKKVGEGFCGQVYKAVAATPQDQLVQAFKFPNYSENNEFEEYLRRGAEVIEKLQGHPNIVQFMGWGESDELELPYLKFEFLDGKDLGDYVMSVSTDSGVRDAGKSLDIILQIMSAIEYVHSKKILHTDLTPPNVRILNKNGVVKIMDFEFVRIINDLGGEDKRKQYVGSKKYYRLGSAKKIKPDFVNLSEYIAPEALEEGIFTEAGDVYSIAKLLHLCLTGQKPSAFGPGWARKVFIEMGWGPVFDIYDKGTGPMKSRYQSVKEMRTSLENIAIGESVDKVGGDFQAEFQKILRFIGRPDGYPEVRSNVYSGQDFLSVGGVSDIGAKHLMFASYVDKKIATEPLSIVRESMLEKKKEIEELVKERAAHDLTSMVKLLVTGQLKENLKVKKDIQNILETWAHYPVASVADYVQDEEIDASESIRKVKGHAPKALIEHNNRLTMAKRR